MEFRGFWSFVIIGLLFSQNPHDPYNHTASRSRIRDKYGTKEKRAKPIWRSLKLAIKKGEKKEKRTTYLLPK